MPNVGREISPFSFRYERARLRGLAGNWLLRRWQEHHL
ncbi:hypothetical protein L581_4468 [Serratia fonticola AU-AP2C]|nr:hypothetical protein L581_4468 [Serratia fonticola AU-AP2C]